MRKKLMSLAAMTLLVIATVGMSAIPSMAEDDPTFLVSGFCPPGFIIGVGNPHECVFPVEQVFPVTGAVPAAQEFSIRRITSGAANPVTNISNTGNNVNLCPTTQQIVNTGNVANEQGVVQSGPGTAAPQLALPFGFFVGDDSLVHDNNGIIVGTVGDFLVPVGSFFVPTTTGDIDITGSEINVDGSVSGSCTQTIEQAAAAGR